MDKLAEKIYDEFARPGHTVDTLTHTLANIAGQHIQDGGGRAGWMDICTCAIACAVLKITLAIDIPPGPEADEDADFAMWSTACDQVAAGFWEPTDV